MEVTTMLENEKTITIKKKGTLLSYRPDIKVMDCTIRDGGLVNNFFFEDDFVKAVYEANIEAGVDYMEIGYKASNKILSPDKFGKWKFCSENDIRRVIGDNDTPLKISVMADAGRTDYHTDILPKEESVIDMIRIATYVYQLPEAVDMIKDAHDKGYETTVNLMAISQINEREINEALEILTSTEVDTIYLVDSFGSLYPEQIRCLAATYLKYAETQGKQIGIHAHNNQQLAFANTIEALVLGASYLDSTISGFGRGAGNCPTELLLGFLKNPKYNIRPLLKFIETEIIPLKSKLKWGYDLPYMLTGQLNQHPKLAIEFLDEDRTDYANLFDDLTEDE
jgi:4-hydroxy 2-oxovalerate aldolase